MKKFLSLFVALAMVLSLFAGVGTRTAQAAATLTATPASGVFSGGSAAVPVPTNAWGVITAIPNATTATVTLGAAGLGAFGVSPDVTRTTLLPLGVGSSMDGDWLVLGFQVITFNTTSQLRVGDTIHVAGGTAGIGTVQSILTATEAMVNVTTAAVGTTGAVTVTVEAPLGSVHSIDPQWKTGTVGSPYTVVLNSTATLRVGDTITVTMVATAATPATASFTLGGAITAGNTVSVTWHDTTGAAHTTAVYTVVPGDTFISVAGSLAALVAGTATAATGGTATVTMTQSIAGVLGNGQAFAVNIGEGVTALTIKTLGGQLSPANILADGGRLQLVAYDQLGNVASGVVWSAIGGIVNASGLVTAPPVLGDWVIHATAGSAVATFVVHVISWFTPTSITLTPASPVAVAYGATKQFIAIISDGTTSVDITSGNTAGTNWTVWMTDLALGSSISWQGLFTAGLVYETGKVYVSWNDLSAFATVTVGTAPVGPPVPGTTTCDATTANITIIDSTGTKLISADDGVTQDYYSTNPTIATEGVLDTLNNGDYVYNMGDIITGKLNTTTVVSAYGAGIPASPWKVSLMQFPNKVIDFSVVSGGVGTFTIGTANVHYDGPYYLRVESLATVAEFGTFDVFNNTLECDVAAQSNLYIKYNVAWVLSTITPCPSLQKISGYVTRGNGQTVDVPVFVGVAYPGVGTGDGKLASYYSISPLSSGQFAMTFLGQANPGLYRVFFMDGYYDTANDPSVVGTVMNYSHGIIATGTNPVSNFVLDHDAMVYKTISTIPTAFAMKATLFTNPVYLYGKQAGQSIVISLVDAFGAPVTVAEGTDWYVEDTSGTVISSTAAPNSSYLGSEIDNGYYKFNIDTTSYAGTDLRFYFTSTLYGVPYTSNTIIVDLRVLSAWNPYLQVDVMPAPILVCSLARSVYDNLPCTIGSGIWLKVGYWPPVAGYQVYPSGETVTFTGPLSWMSQGIHSPAVVGDNVRDSDADGNVYYRAGTWYHFRITKAGAIGASIDETMWQQQDPAFPLDANNACCKTFTKTFTVCEVNSCVTTSIQVTGGAQTDASNITVGSKSDLVISVDPTGAPADLFCGCNSKIVHIYMVNSSCAIVPDAFTVDTYGGGTPIKETELWYNGIPESLRSYGTNLTTGCIPTGTSADGSVIFQATTAGIVAVDNCTTLTFKGVTFNFPNTLGTPCSYHLVVQVFGEERGYNQCGAACPTFPFISESRDPIYINPVSVTKTATATIYESGGVDPTQILAGVPATVEITDPGFSGETSSTWTDPSSTWSFSFKAAGTDTYYDFATWGLPYPTVSKTDTGYRFSSFCMKAAGTIQIYNSSYNTNCMQFEELTVEIEVVMPTFSVKIGLGDGTQLDNDNILTTGFGETVYVTATDPRTDVTHDFSTDSTWHLNAVGRTDSCGLQTAWVCLSSPTGCIGCAGGNALTITAYDNPCLEGAGTVRLYMVTACGSLKVSDFTVTDPTVTVTPATIPFTIPASATHVTFAVKDAHGHGAPGITVSISGSMIPASGASGYSWTAGSVQTGKDPMGEADWAFVPPFSGQYKVLAGTIPCTTVPPVWAGKYAALGATITAKYSAPVVDTTAPVVLITAGIDGSTVSTDVLALTGSVSDNVGVSQLYVGFNKVDVLPDGSFMTNVKLAEGLNTITVVAYDAAGNKGTATVKVTYKPAISTKIVLVLTIGTDIVSVNGKATSIDAAPEIVAGRTFVPIRFIAEAFGATVDWLPETQGITITLGDHTIGLQIGNSTAVIDGSIISLEAAPYIKNGRTMVPLRVISESFGGDVVWDPALRTITITYQP